MKSLRGRLEQERNRTKVPWEVIERDYLLSWILEGIYSTEALSKTMIFKGGTALKKCYFGGHYRFSEDLDFSSMKDLPEKVNLEKILIVLCKNIETKISEYADVKLSFSRYEEQDPHPGGQEAFVIRAQFPWHREPKTPVYVEITRDEPVFTPTALKSNYHPYGEKLTTEIRVYSLEEIVSEKLRAILQQTQKLKQRSWGRSRARDFYDLWSIKTSFQKEINWQIIPDVLNKKCEVRGVSYSSYNDFFNDIVVNHVRKTWNQWLSPLVIELADCEIVLNELQNFFKKIL